MPIIPNIPPLPIPSNDEGVWAGKLNLAIEGRSTPEYHAAVLPPSFRRYPVPLSKLHAALAHADVRPVRIGLSGSSTMKGSNATGDYQLPISLTKALQAAYPSGRGSEHPVILETATPATTSGIQGLNAALSGSNSGTFMPDSRIAALVAAQISALFVAIGSNDWSAGNTPATYKANLQAIITKFKAQATVPMVFVLCHMFRRGDITPRTGYDAYGQALEEIAADDPENVMVIDVARVGDINRVDTTDPLNLLDTDLVHPTNAGHLVTRDTIVSALDLRPPLPAAAAVTEAVPTVSHPIAVDYFARPDGTMDVALSGQTWTAASGTWALAGGRARATTAGTTLLPIGIADNIYVSAIVVLDPAAPVGSPAGVLARAVGDVSRVGVFLAPDGKINTFIRASSASNNNRASMTHPAFRPNQPNEVGVLLKGNVVTSYLNGVFGQSYTLIPAEITAINVAAAGSVGLRDASALHQFESFSVQTVPGAAPVARS